jgi:hypothetical protein
MHDKRRLTDGTMEMIKLWSTHTTLLDRISDGEASWDNQTPEEAYLEGIRAGKAEFAQDILEAQDMINYN